MTHEGLWNELKLEKQIKFLQGKCRKAGKRIKELEAIEKSHKEMNGKLYQELDLEKKNHAITREGVQAKDLELGRLMEKLNSRQPQR